MFYLDFDLKHFLNSIVLPVLSTIDSVALDKSLTLEELQTAAASLPNNKAPGADGLPAEVYKMYGAILLP